MSHTTTAGEPVAIPAALCPSAAPTDWLCPDQIAVLDPQPQQKLTPNTKSVLAGHESECL